jgi:drug/metabolite transporter (DMT)-like permease
MTRSTTGAGLVLALTSAATFGTAGSFAGSLLDSGWTPGAAVIVRVALAAAALTIPALLALRGYRRIHGGDLKMVGAFGVAGVAGAQLAYFQAVQHLSVAVALLLEYSGVLLVVGWLWLRHGHRPGGLTFGGAGLAIGGLALVLDLFGAQELSLVGVLWGLGAAVGLAVYFVLSAKADDALPPVVIAWGGLVVGTATLGAAVAMGLLSWSSPRNDVVLAGSSMSWLVPVLALSLVAGALAYVTGINGVRLLGAKVASFVGLTEVMFAVVFAWLLVDESLSALQLLGGVLVLGGIALVRVDELREPVTSTAMGTDDIEARTHGLVIAAPSEG